MYDKLLLCITAIAILAAEIAAADPLDPSFVGESMSTGMDLGLVQQARDAGIITQSNSLYGEAGGPAPIQLGTPAAGVETGDHSSTVMAEQMAQNTETQTQNINATGAWSLDLKGDVVRHIDLRLMQNKDAIMGNGAMTGENGTKSVTVSGLLSSNRLSLTVMPINSLDLYKLDLSLDSNTKGTYTFYSVGGATQSGDVSGTASIDASVPIYQAEDADADADADAGAQGSIDAKTDNLGANSAAAGSIAPPYKSSGYEPVRLGGGAIGSVSGSGSVSSSTSVGMVSGGGFSSSYSSMSGSM
jgi:hypothetical protein